MTVDGVKGTFGCAMEKIGATEFLGSPGFDTYD